MKPTRIVTLLLLIAGLSLNGKAQTVYHITTNTNTGTGPYAPGTNCSNCDIIINAGVTLTINSTMSCSRCTFSGGIVNIVAGSNLTLNNTDSFKLATVLFSQALNTNTDSVVFYGDTVSLATSMSITNTVFDMDSNRVAVSAALTLGAATFNKDSLHLNANLTLQNATDTIENSNVDLATGVTLTTNTSNFINSTFALAGTSKLSPAALTSSGSNYYLAGTSTFNGTASVVSSGDNFVATGSGNSITTAYALTTTNTNINLSGTTGTLTTNQGFSMTGGSITAASGSTITTAYTSSLTNTTVTAASSTFNFQQGLNTKGGSFTTTGTPNKITIAYTPLFDSTTVNLSATTLKITQGLTDTAGSFTATNGSVITTGYTPTFVRTAASLNGSSFTSGQGYSTSGGLFDLTNATVATAAGYSITMSGTGALVSGTNTVTSSSLSLSNHSWLQIGAGPSTDLSNLTLSGTLSTDNTSYLAVEQDNNYFKSTTGNLATNTDNCGGTYPHACATDYLYGCATVKNNQTALTCTTLALTDINLTAAITGANQVGLTWTDVATGTADHYTVQRNTGNMAWTDIGTVSAGSAIDAYTFTDANAPAGTLEYRILRTDVNGNDLYSDIVSVTLSAAVTNTHIGLFPNPATGGRFNLTTDGTEELLVNVYTTTGQLLYHAALQGQTQYPIQLSSQPLSMSAVIVQTIYRNETHSYTVLVR